jgi:RND superfamily putative drug exporter
MAPARLAGLQVDFSGTAFAAGEKVEGAGEVSGIVIAFVVLAIALGSLIAAGLPLLTALTGVAIGVLFVGFLARFIQMTDTASVLATMLGLAVGIDYALFIVSRHREQLARPGQDITDSIARAIGTAGSSVVFAGSTVIAALAALSLAGIPFLTVMGLAAAGTVTLAILAAVTLVPALLRLAGERLRPGATRRPGRGEAGRLGLAWARLVGRAPAAILVAGVAGLLVLAAPALHIRLGLPGNNAQPAASTQHKSYDLLAEGFGPGFNATLTVVADASRMPLPRRAAVIRALSATLRHDPDVVAVAPPTLNPARTIIVIPVIPKTGPDAAATAALVNRIRDRDLPAVSRAGGTGYVAGQTAADLDVSARLGAALPLFLASILALAGILLTIAFRSLLIPLTAVAGFLLSVVASLGVSVWVLQDGHLAGVIGAATAAPIVSFVPVLLIGVLFGLAMDYEVFLVSRMRESFGSDGNPTAAVAAGLRRSGRVVCAAALIMTSVFAGFIPTGDPIVKSIAFTLTIGVLTDAFVVRLAIIPAVLTVLGRRAWQLPAWLDRLLPRADIEGATLPPTVIAGPPEQTGAGHPKGTRHIWEERHADDRAPSREPSSSGGPAMMPALLTTVTAADGVEYAYRDTRLGGDRYPAAPLGESAGNHPGRPPAPRNRQRARWPLRATALGPVPGPGRQRPDRDSRVRPLDATG